MEFIRELTCLNSSSNFLSWRHCSSFCLWWFQKVSKLFTVSSSCNSNL